METTQKILVIDDEPDVVSYLAAFLEDEGFDVLEAGNGRDGLTLAREQAPDLITLDITMPGMSGIEVLTTSLFFSSKGVEETGLGLLTANKVIEKHRESIEVESEPGKGTCFRIWIPKVRDQRVNT